MTYVIADPCIGEKNGACVDVCPVACIHTTPDAPQHYIDPDVCIECEQCVLVCPVDAIFLDSEVPAEWQPSIEVNAAFFRENKPVDLVSAAEADAMTRAVQEYAARNGLAVAVVVLASSGDLVLSTVIDGTEPAVAAAADQKAYTALVYRLPTQQLRPGARERWTGPGPINQQRLLLAGGGLPLVRDGVVIGAIGVAGADTREHEALCCQVAAETLRLASHAH